MSAGTGVMHSEFNHSSDDALHLSQIWIEPDSTGLGPGYAQQHISQVEKAGTLRLVAAPGGDDGAMTIHQDVRLYAAVLGSAASLVHDLAPVRHAWFQVVAGNLRINDQPLTGRAVVLPAFVSVAGVGKVFDEDGTCTDPAIEKRIRGAATNLLDYIHQNVCPRITLEAMLRENAPT